MWFEVSGFLSSQVLPDREDREEDEEEDKPKKKHVSLHDKHVIGYEDRIRAYSTPDKIFRYFATLQIKEGDGSIHIYMTPDDFLRSIQPGRIQPTGLGLDKFLKMTREVCVCVCVCVWCVCV